MLLREATALLTQAEAVVAEATQPVAEESVAQAVAGLLSYAQ